MKLSIPFEGKSYNQSFILTSEFQAVRVDSVSILGMLESHNLVFDYAETFLGHI